MIHSSVGLCSRGKRQVRGSRTTFRWTAPRFWSDVDVTAAFLESPRRLSCDAQTKPLILVPDVVEGPNGKMWISSPMRCAKFCKRLRAILVVAGVQPEVASSMTVKGLRRVLSTTGDLMGLDDRDAQATGNRVVVPSGGRPRRAARHLMCRRYAQHSHQSAGRVRLSGTETWQAPSWRLRPNVLGS